jgi:hypothetical protein
MASSKSRWRWLGGIALLTSAAMLMCGETVLKGRLGALGFLVYWLVCFFFTATAIVLALCDLRIQRHRARAAHRELVESTLHEIQSASRARAREAVARGAVRENQPPSG